jgi:hypothetical protein
MAVAAAALLGAAAISSSASAATTVLYQGTLSTANAGNNYLNAAFNGYTVKSGSTYYIDFTVPANQSVLSIYTDIVGTHGTDFTAAPFSLYEVPTAALPCATLACNQAEAVSANLVTPSGGTAYNATYNLSPSNILESFILKVSPTAMAGTLQGNIQIGAVPEPATWAMAILGVAMIGFAARRRRGTFAFA